METVLSLRERKRGDKVPIVYSKADLDRYKPGRGDNGDRGLSIAKMHFIFQASHYVANFFDEPCQHFLVSPLLFVLCLDLICNLRGRSPKP